MPLSTKHIKNHIATIVSNGSRLKYLRESSVPDSEISDVITYLLNDEENPGRTISDFSDEDRDLAIELGFSND